MTSVWGQLFLHRKQGILQLEKNGLRIRRHELLFLQWVSRPDWVIPLSAIKELTVKAYPPMVNLYGMDYVDVAYEEAGDTRQLFFTPLVSVWSRAGTIVGVNRRVREWQAAIQAVREGRNPEILPPEILQHSPVHFDAIALSVLAGMTFLGLSIINGSINPRAGYRNSELTIASVLLILAAWLFWMRQRRADGR